MFPPARKSPVPPRRVPKCWLFTKPNSGQVGPLCHSPKASTSSSRNSLCFDLPLFPRCASFSRSISHPETPAHLHYGPLINGYGGLIFLAINDRDSDSSGKVEESRWETHRPQ
ncbi:DNA-repair protein Rad2 [Aspergillus luchuensis]|uniref:DNA-repair protein Rad2 n=1 Tax=Aspergillus kawachii TaxID=1069201 RepID=A0A146FY67_ASPKA|nr:DNA-repair protein Rad2 [Aspergillus luchuensis]